MRECELWDEYMIAYEDAIGATATKKAPWHVIPANQKWFARYLISEAIVGTLEDVDPHYPEMPADKMARLASCRDSLCGKEG